MMDIRIPERPTLLAAPTVAFRPREAESHKISASLEFTVVFVKLSYSSRAVFVKKWLQSEQSRRVTQVTLSCNQ